MASRQTIEIDKDLCIGCGACVAGCPEGALQLIDGKARLASENLCDGLGACIGNCPQGAIRVLAHEAEAYNEDSALRQWPIQLHLVNPQSGQFDDADVLVAADCTAFALGSFHRDLLQGKKLLIACPKLDRGKEIYIEKLAAIIAKARSLSLAIMEVPCCSGLLRLTQEARTESGTTLDLRVIRVGIKGNSSGPKHY